MKHLFFTLLLVGVCLTGTATITQRSDLHQLQRMDHTTMNQTSLVLRTNTLGNQLSDPVMAPAKASTDKTSIQGFFKKNKLTPNDNKLMHKAPKRVTTDDLSGTRIAFFNVYYWEFDDCDNCMVTPDTVFWQGGWDVILNDGGDILYNEDGFYYPDWGMYFYLDYDNDLVYLPVGEEVYTYENSATAGRYKYDTIEHVYLVNETWLTESSDIEDVVGELYNDGSIYVPDGFCFFFEKITSKSRATTTGYTTMLSDTTWFCSPIFRDTYLLTPTGLHTYLYERDGYTYHNDVYMFQYDDTTAVVWNLWGLGNQGAVMNIYGDGTMSFPSMQPIFYYDVSEFASSYPEYTWDDYAYQFFNFGIDIDPETGTSDMNTLNYDVKLGTVTPTQITWDASILCDLVGTDDGYYPGMYIEPYLNNTLEFTNGDYFRLGWSEIPGITSIEYYDHVTVTATPSSEGALAYLYDGNGNKLDNPCSIMRGDEDQVYTFRAVEYDCVDGYYKNASDMAELTITVPAKPVPGDVNEDKVLDINDITVLIDALVSGNLDNINADNADVNEDGSLDLNDLVALIDIILIAH